MPSTPGAWYRALAPWFTTVPPPASWTDQMTLVSAAPVTVASRRAWPYGGTLIVGGMTATKMEPPSEPASGRYSPSPQPQSAPAAARRATARVVVHRLMHPSPRQIRRMPDQHQPGGLLSP